jgi:hypothetical protein
MTSFPQPRLRPGPQLAAASTRRPALPGWPTTKRPIGRWGPTSSSELGNSSREMLEAVPTGALAHSFLARVHVPRGASRSRPRARQGGRPAAIRLPRRPRPPAASLRRRRREPTLMQGRPERPASPHVGDHDEQDDRQGEAPLAPETPSDRAQKCSGEDRRHNLLARWAHRVPLTPTARPAVAPIRVKVLSRPHTRELKRLSHGPYSS